MYDCGRLMTNIIEVYEKQNIGGYSVIMDIKKAFDSLDHDFLVTVLNKFGFGSNFISWIKLPLNSQQSYVVNGGNTIPHFNLDKGDPVSAYRFILALEFFLLLLKAVKRSKV